MPNVPDDQQPPPLPPAKPKTLDDALEGMRPKAKPTGPTTQARKPRRPDDEFEVIDDETPSRSPRAGRRDRDDDEDDRGGRGSRDGRPRKALRDAPKANNTKVLLIVGGVVGLMVLVCGGGAALVVMSMQADKARENAFGNDDLNFEIPGPPDAATPKADARVRPGSSDWQRTWKVVVDAESGITYKVPDSAIRSSATVLGTKGSYTATTIQAIEGPMTYRVEWFDAAAGETLTLDDYHFFGRRPPEFEYTQMPTIATLNGLSTKEVKYLDRDKNATHAHAHRYEGDTIRYYRCSVSKADTELVYPGFDETVRTRDFWNSIKVRFPSAKKPATKGITPPPQKSSPTKPPTTPKGITTPQEPETTPVPTSPAPFGQREFFNTPKHRLEPHAALFELDGDELLTIGSVMGTSGKQESKATVYDAKTFKTLRTYSLADIEGVTEAALNKETKKLYVVTTDSTGRVHDRDKFLVPGQVAAFKLEDFLKEAPQAAINPTATTKLIGHVRTLGIDAKAKAVFVSVVAQSKAIDKAWKTRFLRLKGDTLAVSNELDFPAAMLDATVSPDGKTVALVEHAVNPFGFVSFGTRSPGVVRFVDATTWKSSGQAQTASALSQAAFVDDKTILCCSQSGATTQLIKIGINGDTNAFEPIRQTPATGYLAYDAKSGRLATANRSRLGVTILTGVNVKDSGVPKVFATGLSTTAGPLNGPLKFIAGGRYIVLAGGQVYEFEE